jgi:NRAMP (natural resistance-associated macrophage protein)-like metal ion transporter
VAVPKRSQATESTAAGAQEKPREEKPGGRRVLRTLGLGLITGAADDDPSAIGTYASAGAAIGPSFLWTAPVTFPMMCTVVYLAAKLGQVSGKGLFQVIKDNYPRWILYPAVIGVMIGNTIGAGADIGGMSAAIALLVPLPMPLIIIPITFAIFALQLWGSYTLIRTVFRWLALTLLAYVAAAILAKPDLAEVIRGTLIPTIRFDAQFLSLLVAVIGTTLSTYLYTWQSNQEVEEEIAIGRRRLEQRKGATKAELAHTRADIVSGMFFSNVVMYFIILSTASTLFKAGTNEINTAAEAAEALAPLAGSAASVLFALGVIGVGFLAVPIMTTGAAYDLCQVMGWKHGLHAKPSEAKKFYAAIGGFTVLAMAMNFLGFNPMKALVFAGIVQGFSTPPILLLILLITNNRKIMGNRVNSRGLNILGGITTAAISAATICLVVTWFM